MAAHAMVFSALNPRNRSLPRGTVLVLGSLILAFPLSGFPEDRASLKLLFLLSWPCWELVTPYAACSIAGACITAQWWC